MDVAARESKLFSVLTQRWSQPCSAQCATTPLHCFVISTAMQCSVLQCQLVTVYYSLFQCVTSYNYNTKKLVSQNCTGSHIPEHHTVTLFFMHCKAMHYKKKSTLCYVLSICIHALQDITNIALSCSTLYICFDA